MEIENEFSSKEAKPIQEWQAFGSSAKDKADSGQRAKADSQR
jgi:hypothetical protein